MKPITFLVLFLAFPIQSQVVDVDGDGVVGAHEAIAVAEQWKQEAKAANEHDHLAQTWQGEGSPLKLQGSFSELRAIQLLESKQDEKAISLRSPSAPLVLENMNRAGYGLKIESEGSGISVSSEGPDLILRGGNAVVAATDEAFENLSILCNNNVYLSLDHNHDDPHKSAFYIFGSGNSILELYEDGNMWLRGNLIKSLLTTKIDHPLDPENKYLQHCGVNSPDLMNVYSGNVVLDEAGEAWVKLPSYFEAFNTDFRYQLSCIGSFAPVYVAEEIKNNRFKIAGGKTGMKVSWQVTGIRQDAYAKANPIKVEREKSEEEKGKYLHSELFGEPLEKSVGLVSPE